MRQDRVRPAVTAVQHALRERRPSLEARLHALRTVLLCACQGRESRTSLRERVPLLRPAVIAFALESDVFSGAASARVAEVGLLALTALLGDDPAFDEGTLLDETLLPLLVPRALGSGVPDTVHAAAVFVRRCSELPLRWVAIIAQSEPLLGAIFNAIGAEEAQPVGFDAATNVATLRPVAVPAFATAMHLRAALENMLTAGYGRGALERTARLWVAVATDLTAARDVLLATAMRVVGGASDMGTADDLPLTGPLLPALDPILVDVESDGTRRVPNAAWSVARALQSGGIPGLTSPGRDATPTSPAPLRGSVSGSFSLESSARRRACVVGSAAGGSGGASPPPPPPPDVPSLGAPAVACSVAMRRPGQPLHARLEATGIISAPIELQAAALVAAASTARVLAALLTPVCGAADFDAVQMDSTLGDSQLEVSSAAARAVAVLPAVGAVLDAATGVTFPADAAVDAEGAAATFVGAGVGRVQPVRVAPLAALLRAACIAVIEAHEAADSGVIQRLETRQLGAAGLSSRLQATLAPALTAARSAIDTDRTAAARGGTVMPQPPVLTPDE
jgi:hypothetical protein